MVEKAQDERAKLEIQRIQVQKAQTERQLISERRRKAEEIKRLTA